MKPKTKAEESITQEAVRQIFSRNLRRLMRQKNISIFDLAYALIVADTTVESWYKGAAVPHLSNLVALANYFCVPVGYFYVSGGLYSEQGGRQNEL